jgi:hypothetical protein
MTSRSIKHGEFLRQLNDYQLLNDCAFIGFGRAMAQAVSRRPLTAAAWVRAQVNPVGFVVDKVALGQGLSPSSSVFPCQYHSTVNSTFPKIKKK